MSSRICRCCGEAMGEAGNALSLNPNVCASCASMADGVGESNPTERAHLTAPHGETVCSEVKSQEPKKRFGVHPPALHHPTFLQNSVQLCPALSSVWSGGWCGLLLRVVRREKENR